jgi:hypothetical protein
MKQKLMVYYMDKDIIQGLNFALNEATILGADIFLCDKLFCVTFCPISVLSDNSIPVDNRVLFVFKNIGRIAASLKNDQNSEAIIFPPEKLPQMLSCFKHEQIYGWEFIDNEEKLYKDWKDNKSFDLILDSNYRKQHTIDLFQEDKYSNRNINLRIWFDDIVIVDSVNNHISLETFIANGKRGWGKLYRDGWTTYEKELDEKIYYKKL